MFWVGLVIAFISGILSIFRHKITRKYPILAKRKLDVFILIILLVAGLSISAVNNFNQGLELSRIRKLASPPSLSIIGIEANKEDSAVKVTIYLHSDKNEPLGKLDFQVVLPEDSTEKILNFWPSFNGGAFLAGDGSEEISSDGKNVRLRYALVSGMNPVIDVKLTGITIFTIKGNYGPANYEVDISGMDETDR
ncbi:MAG TPA: hypothetical protein VGA85_03665 [Dehalococcoidales bacterium]